MRRLAAVSVVLGLAGLAAFAQAQDDAEVTEDNGFLINLIQETISAPGRHITIGGVEGALSSQARIGLISIADEEGTWLEIENIEIDWNRLELLVGRLNVDRFSVDRVSVLRKPIPVPAPPVPETDPAPFALPELPVSINIAELEAGSISLDEALFGQAAELGVTGSFSLAGGVLDSALEVNRQDDPGGLLDLEAAFSNESRELGIDLNFQEPEGGIVADLLNIEGEPAIELRVSGAGPLDEVDVTFSMDANQDRIADGLLALRGSDAGLGFDLDLSGGLAPLIPADYRDFFEGETSIQANGVSKSGGGVLVDAVELHGAVLDLSGRVETSEDNFLSSLNLSGTFGDPGAPPVILPVPGAATKLNSATLFINYGNASRWDGLIVLDRLEAGGLEIEDVTLDLGGLAQDLEDAENRNVTLTLDGLVTGLYSADPNVADALPSRLDLFADISLPPGAPIDVRQLQVSGDGISIFTAGEFSESDYSGRASVRVPDLSLLSGVAGRPVEGEVALQAAGSFQPLSGALDVEVEGGASGISMGDPRIDGLLAGETQIGGRAVRDTDGIRVENLRIENPQFRIASDGRVSSEATDIGFEAVLNDLAVLDPTLTGAFEASGQARGQRGPVDVSFTAGVAEGSVAGQEVTGLNIGFEGLVESMSVTGDLNGDGQLGALDLELLGGVAANSTEQSVSGLKLALGDTEIAGDIAKSGTAPVEGRISVISPDLSPLAELAQIDATGTINALIKLGEGQPGQGLSVQAEASDLSFAANSIESLSADLDIDDLLGVPMAAGDVSVSGIVAGGTEISSVNARAEHSQEDRMRFAVDGRLAIGTLLNIGGELDRLPQGIALTLDDLRVRQDTLQAELSAPATVTVEGKNAALSPLTMSLGSGGLTAQGNVGETIDLSVDIDSLPLELANAVQPQLGLAGEINGTATVSGPRSTPDIAFDVSGDGLGAAATLEAGLPPVSFQALGQTNDGLLQLDAGLSAETGLAANVAGAVPIGEGDLDLAIGLEAFELAFLDSLAGNQGLAGSITGQAEVSGPLSAPQAVFDVTGDAISVSLLRDGGLPGIAFSVAGEFAENTVSLQEASVSGPPGLSLNAQGAVPLAGDGLDVSVNGQIPLELTNPILAARAAQASGQIDLDASASGSLSVPQLSGGITMSGGTYTDPEVNLQLEQINLDVGLEGNTIDIRNIGTKVTAGGSISGQGSITVDPAAGFPADIAIDFNDVRYTDGALATTRFSGDFALTGPVLGDGLLAGDIELGQTEISIAEGLGAGSSGLLDEVQHLRPPSRVTETLRRAEVGTEEEQDIGASGDGGGGGPANLRLDISLNAPNRIFIRGRGLDVELSGEVDVGGTVGAPEPTGEFELRRGRIVILAQRIEFTEGTLTLDRELDGHLDPEILFVAETSAGDITARVTVSGTVSDPEIEFSSTPELPEDEVLAQLLFGRAADELSAFQLAQLASAAAELAGVGGSGLMSQLRDATGLDNLDILTEESGATAVRAGKYIDDNVYVDVQTDSEGVSQAGIVLDVTDSLTARGSVASDGNSIFGLFYERDF